MESTGSPYLRFAVGTAILIISLALSVASVCYAAPELIETLASTGLLD